jgi:SAM-dependent methyltransferase
MSSYVFRNCDAEAVDRFASLERCYDPVSTARLAGLGIADGLRCLEVGCGTGSIANWLAERVGPQGSVVATDIDTGRVAPVAANVEVWSHDIVDDELPEAAFDVVHARLVLLHLPQRRRALHRIWHALRPGGRLVLDEFDCTWLPVLAAPDPEAVALFSRVVSGVHGLLESAGADLAWGRNAYGALAECGYDGLDVRGYSEVWTGVSHGAQLHRANVVQTSDSLVASGRVSPTELDRFFELLDSPGFAVSSYLMLSTSACRPHKRQQSPSGDGYASNTRTFPGRADSRIVARPATRGFGGREA